MAAALTDQLDDGVGEGLPAQPLMGGSLARAYGEGGIEQQHALLYPGEELSAGDDGGAAEVVGDLSLDIHQARRHGDARGHGEGQTLGLARAVVGVLA